MNKKHFVIVGMGPTGLAVAKHLAKQGQIFSAVDSRETPPCLSEFNTLFPELVYKTGSFDADLINQADCLVISPGIGVDELLLAKEIPVIGDIELFAQAVQAPVIGITGSNGKSTVTALLGEMLKQAGYRVLVGGNIGRQALDLLNDPVPEVYVLELSSFQLETTNSLHLAAGVITNISDDHLDRYHGSLDEYTAAKLRIFQHCQQWVLPKEGDFLKKISPHKNIFYFTLNSPNNNNEFGLRDGYLARGEENIFPLAEMFLKASHDIENALTALALGVGFGADPKKMALALRDFQGLPHRCQLVADYKNIKWFDDSKGTNVGATIAAIKSVAQLVPGKVILIAGGLTKGADLQPLSAPIHQYVRTTLLIGQDAEKIAAVLPEQTYQYCDSMEQVIQKAALSAEPGDAVLLSPAAASFDMFKNYVHRGEVFAETVKAYVETKN